MSNVLTARPQAAGLLRLPPQEVHIWGVQLDIQTRHDFERCLSGDEVDRANRFHRFHDRRRYAVTRSFLRVILSRYVDIPPRNLRFTYGPFGKPALSDSPAATYHDIRFNVAHSGPYAIFAVANGREIGIDLEEVARLGDIDHLAERFFSRSEVNQLRLSPPDTQLQSFFRCWTRKEAYVKARGSGLSHPLETFDVLGRKPWVHDHREPNGCWWICDLPAPSGYAAALVVQDAPQDIRICLHTILS